MNRLRYFLKQNADNSQHQVQGGKMSHQKLTLKDLDLDSVPVLMSVGEFAPVLGYTETYVARLCKEGVIPATKVGRAWRIPTQKALEKLGVI